MNPLIHPDLMFQFPNPDNPENFINCSYRDFCEGEIGKRINPARMTITPNSTELKP